VVIQAGGSPVVAVDYSAPPLGVTRFWPRAGRSPHGRDLVNRGKWVDFTRSVRAPRTAAIGAERPLVRRSTGFVTLSGSRQEWATANSISRLGDRSLPVCHRFGSEVPQVDREMRWRCSVMRAVLSTTSNRKTVTVILYSIVSGLLEHLIRPAHGLRRRWAAPVGVPVTTPSRRAPPRRDRSRPAPYLSVTVPSELEPRQRFAVSVFDDDQAAWRDIYAGRARGHRSRRHGTESSNSSPSSAESAANSLRTSVAPRP
jgi:hypothetical protein